MPIYTPPTSIRLLSSAAAAGSASVDFIGLINGTYEHFIIEVANAIPAVNNDSLRLRTSSDGGATWASASGDYSEAMIATASTVSTTETAVRVTSSGIVSSNAFYGGASALIRLIDPASGATAKELLIQSACSADASSDVQQFIGGAKRRATNAINAVRLFFAAGNIVSGKFKLYGVTRT